VLRSKKDYIFQGIGYQLKEMFSLVCLNSARPKKLPFEINECVKHALVSVWRIFINGLRGEAFISQSGLRRTVFLPFDRAHLQKLNLFLGSAFVVFHFSETFSNLFPSVHLSQISRSLALLFQRGRRRAAFRPLARTQSSSECHLSALIYSFHHSLCIIKAPPCQAPRVI
jgi:hypothetical protein